MQLRKKWLKLISAALLTVLLSCLLSAVFWPEKTSQFIGYRFYTVLTDSMEPIIPTHSLVFSKRIDEDEPLQPDTIVTFHANRFGKDILLTHYFKKTQVKDGITYYRTQGASAKDYDNYETTRSDIIGKYMFHIPYLGKIFLFLKSPFGLLMYAELAVIFLINRVIRTRWEEKDKEIKEKEKALSEVKKQMQKRLSITKLTSFIDMNDTLHLHGTLTNYFPEAVSYIVAKLTFYDEQKHELFHEKWYLCGKEGILAKESKDFSYTHLHAKDIAHYHIALLSYKNMEDTQE